MASPAVSFARENQKRFLEELKDLLGRVEFEFDPAELRQRERRRVR